MPKKEQVRQMFDNIAGDYDRLNHIMSLDVDKSWRRRALGEIAAAPEGREGEIDVLDLACGTGDFSIAIAKGVPGSRVTGVDLSEGMLEVMRKKVAEEGLESRIEARQGDGEALPFPDGSFDRVTIAFGIRNFENREKGLREMLRVLRPGGKLVILELSVPENRLIRWAYNLYFLHILPKIGGGISGRGEKLAAPLRERLKKEIYGGDASKLDLRIAELGNDAGVLGACALAMRNMKEKA